MEKLYDLVIIGSGPAGLGAAIYARRAMLDAVTIEKGLASGGQILNTEQVDNYPGIPAVGGFDLGMKLREHADSLGAAFAEDEVVRLELEGDVKRVVCREAVYETRTVIIATGAHHRPLGVPGEERLVGAGVSYCATCDGAFVRNKVTAVVGGGDVAIGDAIFLSRMCKKVYVIHRRDELRGAKSLQEKLFGLPNVEMVWDSVVDEIRGDSRVEGLKISNKKTGETLELSVDGVFIAVGIMPEKDVYDGLLKTDAAGYIEASEDGATSVKGVFAAGDVRTKQLRQVITAVSDGANCITSVERYLAEQ